MIDLKRMRKRARQCSAIAMLLLLVQCGDAGPMGEQGETGSQGPPGENATGAKGDPGDKGASGAEGDEGPKGDKGDTGDEGSQGDDGDSGSDGALSGIGALYEVSEFTDVGAASSDVATVLCDDNNDIVLRETFLDLGRDAFRGKTTSRVNPHSKQFKEARQFICVRLPCIIETVTQKNTLNVLLGRQAIDHRQP